jgi:spermidine synthase
MKPYKRLDEAAAPDGTILTLFEHDGAYVIRVDGVELMSTRRSHSETALAGLVCAPLAAVRGARVLVGGLGLGFTLKGALAHLPPDAEVVVAELLQPVIDWNANTEYNLAHDALADPRVTVKCDDVGRVLQRSPGAFDAIMLDVDNGAESLTTHGNRTLYRSVGVHMAAAALRPGGQLAYWSSSADDAFEATLRHAGLHVVTHSVRAHVTSGPWHTIFVAQQ